MRKGIAALNTWARDLRERLGRRTYSQEGEDLIFARYFESQASGFYVDVGAHHPHRFSNTYLLYARGWSGVNIDALPGAMRKFVRSRPRDINIEAAIGMVAGTATYYMFNEPALNTFDRELAAQRREIAPYKQVAEITLPVRTLAEVLDETVRRSQGIDLFTVDVEGRDLDVLKSNDWDRYRPRVVLAESLGGTGTFGDLHQDPLVAFLASLGYVPCAKTFNTIFMLDAQ